MEFIRNQTAKLLEMVFNEEEDDEEEVYYDAVGYDAYFGPLAEGESAPVDPRNWDLYWVTHPNGPLDELPPRVDELNTPELDFPREDATQGLIDVIINQEEDDLQVEAAGGGAAAAAASPVIADDLRSSIAKLSTVLEAELALASPTTPDAAPETQESVAAPRPASLFSGMRSLLPTIKLRRPKLPSLKLPKLKLPKLKLPSFGLKLPSLKLPTLTLPASAPTQPGTPEAETTKEPKTLHYARTPLATYARVKSRLQDHPPLVAAFADQVSVLSPSSLAVSKPPESSSSKARNLRTSVLMKNLRDMLPTPVAALLAPDGPRKRSLVSILGGRAAKKLVAEIEHDPLDDSMIPQYQKWKKIKNKNVHNAQWSCLITACVLLICAIHIPKLREIKYWKFEFWQWLALGFVALAGRLVSGWCVKLMVILIEYNFLLKKRILYFIFGLRRPVKNNLWLGFVLLTWSLVTQHTSDVSDTIPTITKLLVCAFTAATLWVIKVLLVKILANTFHRTAYFDRIQDTLFHQYILEALSQPRTLRSRGAVAQNQNKRRAVFKLRVTPSQKKMTPRDARKQGRIERQYSPTLTKFRVRTDKQLEARAPAWAKYKDTDTGSSTLTSWVSKVPSIFLFASTFPSVGSASPPRSPKSQPQTPVVTTPSNLKGGSDLPLSLERKSSLKQSRLSRFSRPKVAFQEELTPAQMVESSPSPTALLLEEPEAENVTRQGVIGEVAIQPEMIEEVLVAPPVEPLDPVAAAIPENDAENELEDAEKEPVPAVAVGAIPVTAVPTPAETAPPAFEEPDIEMEEGELEDETGHEQQTTLAQDKIQVLTKDSVSAWTLMRLMKVVRTRNLHMYSKSSLLEPDWEIDSIPMATLAAQYLFKNVAEPGQTELLLKNFMKFFPPNKATQAFSTFEVTVDGSITKKGLLKWVLDVYKERKSLSLTLNDNRTVIYQINLLLDGVLVAVILAISFLIMSFDNKALLVCTTMLLSPAVSIFGNLLRNTFESILFLFIVHPFDVGDRVSVEGVPLMVEEMRIMSTLFLNNSSEHITYPNFILINKPIANIHRSPDQWDAVEFQILVSTPLEKLSILRNQIDKYVVSLPQIWYPRWRLIVKDIDDTNKLRLMMSIQHHINFQDAGERTQRRSDMLVHIQALMTELKIGYKLPPGEALIVR